MYIRLDDDVVWLEENFFKDMIEFRINNPEPLFIYPNIINNANFDANIREPALLNDILDKFNIFLLLLLLVLVLILILLIILVLVLVLVLVSVSVLVLVFFLSISVSISVSICISISISISIF
jgi:hypothetical protein